MAHFGYDISQVCESAGGKMVAFSANLLCWKDGKKRQNQTSFFPVKGGESFIWSFGVRIKSRATTTCGS